VAALLDRATERSIRKRSGLQKPYWDLERPESQRAWVRGSGRSRIPVERKLLEADEACIA